MASTEPEHEHREEEEAPTNEDEDQRKERGAGSLKFSEHKERQRIKAVVSVPTMDPPSRVCSTPDSSCGFELSSSPPSTSYKTLKELLLCAQLRHKIFHDEIVVKAFDLAVIAHKWQKRLSGHPYVQHCVETAEMLALIGADSTVVAAGLLHDTLDDSFMSYDYVFETFGAQVADLVKGVSELSHLSKLARHSNTANETGQAYNMHTMLLAKADARALLIKLADRLHNMMTLDELPPAKRHRFAEETLKIFAPLANRLGISTWKEMLENLCFKHLHPCEHEKLSKLVGSFDENMIDSAIGKLKNALHAEGISYIQLSGRQKSLYSIRSKMDKKKLNMDEIHDIHGLRLIVDNVKDCNKALKVVHQQWPIVPGRLKNYIRQPKSNGYQSLHTVVYYKEQVPLEVQIRTKEMHEKAEFSFAAHWIYKEGHHEHSVFVLKWIEWAQSVITEHCETMKSSNPDSTRPPCTPPSGQDGPVFVIIKDKDKMSVREISANTTITDLLEESRREGSRSKEELNPRLNFRPVNDPTCELKMGDVLEFTSSARPQRSKTTWLVLTPSAQPQRSKTTWLVLTPSAQPQRSKTTGFKVVSNPVTSLRRQCPGKRLSKV